MKQLSSISGEVIRNLKHTESPIEVVLFKGLMRNSRITLCQESDNPSGEGLFLFPQKQVGKYRADFIIRALTYPPAQRVWPPKLTATIAIECDGHEFHSTPEQIEYDKARDEYFSSQGIYTIRIKGKDIHNNVEFCVDEILHFIDMNVRRVER